MPKYYKSKSIMPLGILAIAVVVGIAGSLVSFLYLKINQVCPIIYLSILCALGFGALMGGVAYLLIKIMKIHSAFSGCLGIILGCIIFNLFRWALYVQWDYEKFYYEPAKDESAFTYYEFNYDFATYVSGNESKASSYDLYSDEDLEGMVNAMQNISIADYAEYFGEDPNSYLVGTMTMKDAENMSAFDYFYMPHSWTKDYYFYSQIVNDKNTDKIVESIKKAYKMDLYEYYYEYLEAEPVADVQYLMTHPSFLWESVKRINEEGRWTYTSKPRYSSSTTTTSTSSEPVNGVILWIVWLGELLLICIPAILIASKRAAKPYIESEKAWAELNDSDGFMFRSPGVAQAAAQALRNDPEVLFTYEHLLMKPGSMPFLKVQIYHSKDYEENYINLILRSYVPKNNNYADNVLIKYMYVDKAYIYKLFTYCKQHVPFDGSGLGGVNSGTFDNAENVLSGADIINAFNGTAPVQNDAARRMTPPVNNQGMMDEISMPGMAGEKSQQDIFDELNK